MDASDDCVQKPSGMRMDEIVRWESKWYSNNHRRRWCFRGAAVIAVQVRVGSTNRAFLHGLTTRTGGCGEGLVNRTKLHNHSCQRGREVAAPPALASGKGPANQWCC